MTHQKPIEGVMPDACREAFEKWFPTVSDLPPDCAIGHAVWQGYQEGRRAHDVNAEIQSRNMVINKLSETQKVMLSDIRAAREAFQWVAGHHEFEDSKVVQRMLARLEKYGDGE